MLILSTMAVAIVEFLHRFRQTREIYFEKIVSHIFEDLIWPKLSNQLSLNKKASYRKEFVRTMVSVTGLSRMDLSAPKISDDEDRKILNKDSQDQYMGLDSSPTTEVEQGFWNSARYLLVHRRKYTERLNSVEFAQRIALTKVGMELMSRGENYSRKFILDLTRNLESISSGASSDFRHRSRKYALISAFILAPLLNVDSIFILKSYIKDPELSINVIKLGSETESSYQQGQANLKALEMELEQSTDPNARAAMSVVLTQTKAHFEAAQKEIESNAKKVIEAGLPMGTNYFPFCVALPSDSTIKNTKYADPRCYEKYLSDWQVFLNWISWFVGLILSALLIGQGSPFWFQIYQRLSTVAGLVRNVKSFTTNKQKEQAAVQKDAEQPTPEKAAEFFVDSMKVTELNSLPLINTNALDKYQREKLTTGF
jgi:hypothetical protein